MSAFFLNQTSRVDQNSGALTLVEFNKRVNLSNKPVLVYFYAEWCMVCPKLKPTIEQIENDYRGKAEVLRIDIDKSKEVKDEFEVDALPVLMLYKGGKRTWIYVGLTNKKTITEQIDVLL